VIGPVPRCRRRGPFGDDFRRLLDLRIVLFIQGPVDLRDLRRSRRVLDDDRLSRRATGRFGEGSGIGVSSIVALDLRTANLLSSR
jgi:hypothetical protein